MTMSVTRTMTRPRTSKSHSTLHFEATAADASVHNIDWYDLGELVWSSSSSDEGDGRNLETNYNATGSPESTGDTRPGFPSPRRRLFADQVEPVDAGGVSPGSHYKREKGSGSRTACMQCPAAVHLVSLLLRLFDRKLQTSLPRAHSG